jgi:hypothetical protein
MESTTDLKVLVGQIVTHQPVLFTWGEFISLHEVGEYSIIEYHPWKQKGASLLTGQPSEEISFHPYINGRSLSHSFKSLDEALVFCIAYKFDGCNTRANQYFFGGIGSKHSEEYCYTLKNKKIKLAVK